MPWSRDYRCNCSHRNHTYRCAKNYIWTNPRLQKFDRDVIAGRQDIGLKVRFEFADGTTVNGPIPNKLAESIRRNLRK
jgi:hypothetical protein